MGCDHNDQEHDSNGHQNDANYQEGPVFVLRRRHQYVDNSGLPHDGFLYFETLHFGLLGDGLLYFRFLDFGSLYFGNHYFGNHYFGNHYYGTLYYL